MAISFVLAKEKIVSLKPVSTALSTFSNNILKVILLLLSLINNRKNLKISPVFQQIGFNYQEKNLVFSPLSAHVILSLTAYGAGGNTAKQIRAALGFSKDSALGAREFQYLTEYLNVGKNGFCIHFEVLYTQYYYYFFLENRKRDFRNSKQHLPKKYF